MKVVILAGGLGTRLQEETLIKPKPMVEVGGSPILWHIMKIYAAQGFNEFVVSMGYRSDVIKQYFLNYHYINNDITVDLKSNQVTFHQKKADDWVIHLVDTGVQSETGGRIRRLAHILGDETFMLTYGDGVADIDLAALTAMHQKHGKLVTVTAVHPPARFGGLTLEDQQVSRFAEKLQVGDGWINGGFFVLDPRVLSYIENDFTPWEGPPMDRLVREGQVAAYKHQGFWQCMDTPRDMRLLDSLWAEGSAPWKVWE